MQETKPNKVVYFPSLSSGAFAQVLKKDAEITPGVPYRFWDKRTPEEWRYPYFLVTAGHYYKKPTLRADWGLDKDCLVFGDSGGFQIATGALKWDVALRDTIFQWLENNSDLAANLDIPPRTKYQGRFQEALDFSIDNFKHFEKNQSGKTRFLNVSQGSNPKEREVWFNAVKDFEFQGWSLGGSRRIVDLLHGIALMLQHKEFDKLYNTWVHVLGASKVSDFLVYGKLQQMFNKAFDNRITLSTDSSSPGQYPIFGQMVWDADWRNHIFQMLYFPKDGTVKYPKEGLVPSLLNHPGSKTLTWPMVEEFKGDAAFRMTYHNLHMYVYTCAKAEEIVTMAPPKTIEDIVSRDMSIVLQSIEEMFESSNPMQVFESYRPYYVKIGGDNLPIYSIEAAAEFFDFS
jgi:hypothetical protein